MYVICYVHSYSRERVPQCFFETRCPYGSISGHASFMPEIVRRGQRKMVCTSLLPHMFNHPSSAHHLLFFCSLHPLAESHRTIRMSAAFATETFISAFRSSVIARYRSSWSGILQYSKMFYVMFEWQILAHYFLRLQCDMRAILQRTRETCCDTSCDTSVLEVVRPLIYKL